MTTTSGGVARFKDANFIVNGPLGFRVDGFDDGVSVSFAPQGDKNSYRKGNDGFFFFSELQGIDLIATISLLSGSQSNDKMSAWLLSGLSQGISFKDLGSTSTVDGASTRIRQIATLTAEAGVPTRAWDILIPSASIFIGGLIPPTP